MRTRLLGRTGLKVSEPAMPGVTSAIIGARNLTQLHENIGTGDWDFPSGEWEKIDEASALPAEYPQDFQGFVETVIHGDLPKHWRKSRVEWDLNPAAAARMCENSDLELFVRDKCPQAL